jgi:signal transduction histidine kinase
MPDGGIITIQTENIETVTENLIPLPIGKYVRITIEDQGIGISENHLSNIFDPYFSTKQSGSGLGLATSYSIIQKHGGHISVESKIEIGTTFTIYLPVSEKEIQMVEEKENIKHSGQGKVLIMDDVDHILKMAGRMKDDINPK